LEGKKRTEQTAPSNHFNTKITKTLKKRLEMSAGKKGRRPSCPLKQGRKRDRPAPMPNERTQHPPEHLSRKEKGGNQKKRTKEKLKKEPPPQGAGTSLEKGKCRRWGKVRNVFASKGNRWE